MTACDRRLLALTLTALLLSGGWVVWHDRRDVAWVQAHECFLKADLEAASRGARVGEPPVKERP